MRTDTMMVGRIGRSGNSRFDGRGVVPCPWLPASAPPPLAGLGPACLPVCRPRLARTHTRLSARLPPQSAATARNVEAPPPASEEKSPVVPLWAGRGRAEMRPACQPPSSSTTISIILILKPTLTKVIIFVQTTIARTLDGPLFRLCLQPEAFDDTSCNTGAEEATSAVP